MYKVIHLLKAGPGVQLSDHELACINSWKAVYPDFKIKVWTDSEIKELAQDCLYARDNYEKGRFAYVIDYVRLKILYEHGGIYMDTDVYCANRVPDSYFEKSFLSWDDKLEAAWSNNGCVTYAIKGDPIFKEFYEKCQTLKYDPENPWHNNWPIDSVLTEKYGFKTDDKIYCSLEDQDLGPIKIVNRIQFGVNDYLLNKTNFEEGKQPYFIHCHALAWMGPFVSNTGIYYGLLDDTTDINKFSKKVDEWIASEPFSSNNYSTLVIFVNSTKGIDEEFCYRLLSEAPKDWKNGKKFWLIMPLGGGLSSQEFRSAAFDFLVRRFNNITFCRNIMNE